jgi:hypothetical protein
MVWFARQISMHLTYLAKSCGVASSGISHQTCMAHDFDNCNLHNQIVPFVSSWEFHNVFGMSHNNDHCACQNHNIFHFHCGWRGGCGSSEPGDEPWLSQGCHSANGTPIRLVQCGDVFYPRCRIDINLHIGRSGMCVPIDFRSKDDRQNWKILASPTAIRSFLRPRTVSWIIAVTALNFVWTCRRQLLTKLNTPNRGGVCFVKINSNLIK